MRSLAVHLVAMLLVVGLAMPADAQSWKGRARMAGEVTDPDGNPVAGAMITLRLDGEGPEPLNTNKKGRFSTLGLARGDWEITVVAEGFMISKGTISVTSTASGPPPRVPISLKWQEKSEAPAPPPEADFSARETIEEGNRLLLAGDHAGARAAYETALPYVEEASRGPVLRGIASTWHGEGDDARAIEVLEQVVAESPGDVEATRMLVSLLVAEDRDEEAREYAARLPEEAGIDAAAGLTMGIDLYNAGDLDGALEQFDRVVRGHPERADGYYYRGLIHLNQGANDDARADFERLLELDPEHARVEEVRGFLEYLSDSQ